MIVQGGNLPILFSNIPISLDSIADVSVGIYTQKDGKELKHWGKDDLTITENGILAPISQSESMGLPVGFCYVELKFTDNSGMILPGVRVMIRVSRRDDKTELSGEQPQTLRYVDIDCSNVLTDVGAVVGASAYEVAVKNGFIGTVEEWLNSLHGKDGKDGKDGAPGAPGEPGTPGTNGKDGDDGITPHIGANGNWFIGETDTGIKAQGSDGEDGITPHIGANGHWYIGETDTGVTARGKDGEPGKDGKSAYEYAQEGGYTGTKEEFAHKLATDLQLDDSLKDNTKAAPAGLVGELKSDLSDKIDKPSTAPEVGKILKVTAVNEDGTFTCEWADAPSGGGAVDDVRVNGTSIVADGVANIPTSKKNGSTQTTVGLVGIYAYTGLDFLGGSPARLSIRKANDDEIIDRSWQDICATTSNYDKFVKAAMCDGKGTAWTDVERIAALLRMGCMVDDNGFVKWTAQEVAE